MSDAPTLIALLLADDGPRLVEERFVALGAKPFHARIALREVFDNGVLTYDGMTGLGAGLRRRLADELPLLRSEIVHRSRAADETTKLLLRFPDGATVETVHIPSRRADKGATLCVSSQVGCPVACPFCASGRLGLTRNLAAHEILEQYLHGRALGPLARSVVMGIGEPLLNFDALDRALAAVRGRLGLGARRITVSTVGFPERLRRLAPTRPGFQLAISLHTADDAERDGLVPAMAGVPIDEVLAAGDDWFEHTGREVTYEVALLGGLNDDLGHAERLAERLRGRRATVNLIPFNPVEPPAGLPAQFHRPAAPDVEAFRACLEEHGIVATVRWSRGLEADAACGQLRLRAT